MSPPSASSEPPSSLFEDRTRDGSSAYTTPTYEVLNERTGQLWDRVRATLDAWFVRVPARARPQIRERFASETTIVHLGAFWELYLHEAFLRLGFDVDVDIGRDSDEGRRRPDLLVRRGTDEFYVEATAVQGDDVLGQRDRKLSEQLKALINQTRSPDFLLALEVIQYGSSTPGRRDVVGPLECWLGGLDPDHLLAAEHAGSPPQRLSLEFGGWQIQLEAIPLKPELRDRENRRILAYTDDPIGEIDDIGPILRKLKRKAGHYGELDRPYVIALLCAGTFVEETDIEQAVLGEIVGAHGSDGAFRWVRERNGGWMHSTGPTNTRVSAVLTAIGLHTAGITAVEPHWWSSPWARRPLSTDLVWERSEPDDRGVVVRRPATMTAAEVFALPARWPAVGP